MGKRSIHKSV